MAFDNFQFDPPGGFEDTGFYEDTPADSRTILQRQHNQTKDFINSLVATLSSGVEGESGSESVGSPHIDGVAGTNVFDQIKDIKRQLTDVGTGSIPDGSVSSIKLAAGCVTDEKISDNQVGTNHFKANAVAPMAADTEKVNGIASASYEPVETYGGIGSFRERVSNDRFAVLRGATRDGVRYIVNYNGEIQRLSLSDFSLSLFADFSSRSHDPSIAFDRNGDLYAAYIYLRNREYYFNLSKYSDGEFVNIADFALFTQAGTYSSELIGIEIYDGKLYVFCRYVSADDYIYIWRADIENAGNTNAYEHIISQTACSRKIYPFIYGGDLYVGSRVYENCDPDNDSEHQYSYIAPIAGKGFLSDNDTFLVIGTDHRPCTVSSINKTPSPSNCFCDGRYLYMLFDNYIFRARIY